MRILVIDPIAGAAGDMLVGGLLAVGADWDAVRCAMASVVAEPEIGFADRAGIRAVRVKTNAGHAARSLDEVLARVAAADAPTVRDRPGRTGLPPPPRGRGIGPRRRPRPLP